LINNDNLFRKYFHAYFYAYYTFDKRRAFDAWAMRLLEIVNDEKRGDNVVTLGALVQDPLVR
jgi:hypothetical protein